VTGTQLWVWIKGVWAELLRSANRRPLLVVSAVATVVPPVILAGAWALPIPAPKALQLSGVLLQVVGLVVLVVLVNSLRKELHVSQRGYDEEFREAFRRLAGLLSPKSPEAREGKMAAGETGADLANLRGSTRDLDERVLTLERELASLREQVHAIPGALTIETDKKIGASTTQLISALLRGGIWELIAIFWVMGGVVLATLSEELACILGGG